MKKTKKDILSHCVLAAGGASTLLFAVMATIAMFHDGTVVADFNQYNEGWAEVVMFVVLTLLYPWALWKVMK